jgi:hypothetical protein
LYPSQDRLNKGNWFKKPKIKNTNTNSEPTVMGRNTSPLIPATKTSLWQYDNCNNNLAITILNIFDSCSD